MAEPIGKLSSFRQLARVMVYCSTGVRVIGSLTPLRSVRNSVVWASTS